MNNVHDFENSHHHAVAQDIALLTQDEMTTLVRNTIQAAGDEGISEGDLERIVGWAERARFDAVMLGLVLDGKVGVSVADGEITFSSPPEPDASA